MKIHVVLTKQDADIAAFKKSLPQGQWSKHVVQIMTAAMRDRVADIPMNVQIEPMDKNLHTKISLPEKTAQRFCEKFGHTKGSFTTGIKAELRKCIRKNLHQQTVKRFSSAESRGKIAHIPHEFSSAKEEQKLSCRLVIRDGAALDFLAKILKGEIKTTIVKIIRKHIRKNRETPPEPIGIRRDLLLDVLQGFRTKMDAKEAEYAGVPNKYSKLSQCYDKAHNARFQAILDCANAGDGNQCDLQMRQIDYAAIVDAAFDEVFGSDTNSADENSSETKAKVIEPKAKSSFLPDSYFRVLKDYYKEDD